MSDKDHHDKDPTPNLSAWKGATHFQTWKVELQKESMRLQVEYIPKSAQHAFAFIQMEVDPALIPPEAMGRRILKTSVEDYPDNVWKDEFKKGKFPLMLKAESLKGLKQLMGHSTWNSSSADYCDNSTQLLEFQMDRLDEWFARQNR
eukprot:3015036-Rhodomonas_salina.1